MGMCGQCFEEAGSPADMTPNTRLVVTMIKDLYEEESMGGPPHAVIDDYNLGGGIEPYPVDCTPEVWSLCERIAEILNGMTERERYAVMGYVDGYITFPSDE